MGKRNLLFDPVWRADEVGLALPDSPHAVSVALPRWRDVVGYEEKWPDVVSRLQSGYPRFVIHRLVRELARHIGGDLQDREAGLAVFQFHFHDGWIHRADRAVGAPDF